MPTINPRVNVTLSPSLDALVSRLAQLQRVSKASVLRELLEGVEPQLTQVVALMEAASRVQVESRSSLANDIQRVLTAVEKDAAAAMSKAANLTSDLVAEAETIRSRRPARKSSRRTEGPQLGSPPARRSGRETAVGKGKDPLPSKRGVKR